MTIKIALITFIVAAISFSSCKPNQQSNITNTAPGAINVDTLSYETALRYVKNYERNVKKIDVDSLYIGPKGDTVRVKKPNTRAMWFSAARIDSIAARMHREGADGIRFYLAAYDTTNNPRPALKAHLFGYTTLVVVETKDSTGKDKMKYHRDFYKKKRAGQNGITEGIIIGNPPENRGEQCPPPVTCGKIGATLIE